jgi:aminoglycoside phosphotransferase (APT) family kinase protein
MREDHYSHGWLPAVLPADAHRFRVADETLAEVLASVGAELVESEPEVEIVLEPNLLRGNAPLAIVTVDPRPRRGGGRMLRGAKRLANAFDARARARRAERSLRERGYEPSVLRWDIGGRADLPFVSVGGRSLSERFPQRAIALGRRGAGGATTLEAALAEAERAAGEELRPEWVSVRAGLVVVAAGPAILRVAIGRARSQIRDQIAALGALEAADPPLEVAERIPWVIAHGRVGLGEWSLERRLRGARPDRRLEGPLLDQCLEFLVALRRAGGGSRDGSTFSQLVEEPAGVARGESAETLRALGVELDRSLEGLERSFAHGDFFAGNLLAEDGRLTGVLDWDAGGPGRVPALDLLHLQLTREPYGSDDHWGRAVVERLLPAALAGGDPLLRRYCAELGIEPEPRRLEALVFAYWLEYAAYQLRTHLDRRLQPRWIEGNVELVARAAEAFVRGSGGRDGRAEPTRTA